ncbi:MAG: peptide chain release factor N(5)-glutamine methyltransferase [Chloroflexales bacterium]|nr:peptide chain release factor N(5)-glutamine methyltransferase [Chloroflexales bacterium]
MPTTVGALLRAATAELSAASPTARLDAELLLAHVLAWPRARLLAEREQRPTGEQTAAFAALLARRAAGEPIAYLTGHKEFYGLALEVTPDTLVPRPETELLVDLALEAARELDERRRAKDGGRAGQAEASPSADSPPSLIIADIGTGTGAIAIALASHLPKSIVYATDLSAAALAAARRNVERYELDRRVRLLHGDLLAPLPEPVDLLVSNPPYTILAEVEPNVRAHEPWLALDGGPDGAAIYRRLLAIAPAYLRPGGAVLLEIGAWQGALVADLLRAALPEATVSVHQDLSGRDRVVRASKK